MNKIADLVKTLGVSGGGVEVTHHGELILVLAGHAELGRQTVTAVAHHLTYLQLGLMYVVNVER